MGHLSPDYYVQDGVIPRTQMAYVLKEIEGLSEKYGYRIANVFHAGDGEFDPLILYDNSVKGALERVEELGGEIPGCRVKVGGSLSAGTTASVLIRSVYARYVFGGGFGDDAVGASGV